MRTRTLVAITRSSRGRPRLASASPTMLSDSPSEYTLAVSMKLTPASNAAWIWACASGTPRRADHLPAALAAVGHGAQADLRNVQAGAAQQAVTHGSSPMCSMLGRNARVGRIHRWGADCHAGAVEVVVEHDSLTIADRGEIGILHGVGLLLFRALALAGVHPLELGVSLLQIVHQLVQQRRTSRADRARGRGSPRDRSLRAEGRRRARCRERRILSARCDTAAAGRSVAMVRLPGSLIVLRSRRTGGERLGPDPRLRAPAGNPQVPAPGLVRLPRRRCRASAPREDADRQRWRMLSGEAAPCLRHAPPGAGKSTAIRSFPSSMPSRARRPHGLISRDGPGLHREAPPSAAPAAQYRSEYAPGSRCWPWR